MSETINANKPPGTAASCNKRVSAADSARRFAGNRIVLFLAILAAAPLACSRNNGAVTPPLPVELQSPVLSRELKKRPNDAGLHCEIGTIMIRNDKEEQAVQWLQRALELDPNHRQAHQALAEYYERKGQREKADWHRSKLQ